MRKSRLTPSVSRRAWLQMAAAGTAALWTLPARAAVGGAKILIVGDSMIAGGFGLFLERALRKEHGYAVKRRGKSSSGLARPDFFNWFKQAEQLVKDFTPDASVVMFGGNDVQGLYMGKGQWIRWQQDEWPEEYARRIQAFCDLLSPQGQSIYWVGLPIMRPAKFRGRVERVNTIYRAEMAIRSGAEYIDTWPVLANADGEYADRIYLEPEPPQPSADADPAPAAKRKRVRVRAGDGIHLSPAGAHVLKAHVLEILLPALEKGQLSQNDSS